MRSLYNILFIEHFAAEMLPLAFFIFKLSKFIVYYGVCSKFLPLPAPELISEYLYYVLEIHTTACSSYVFLGLDETSCQS